MCEIMSEGYAVFPIAGLPGGAVPKPGSLGSEWANGPMGHWDGVGFLAPAAGCSSPNTESLSPQFEVPKRT